MKENIKETLKKVTEAAKKLAKSSANVVFGAGMAAAVATGCASIDKTQNDKEQANAINCRTICQGVLDEQDCNTRCNGVLKYGAEEISEKDDKALEDLIKEKSCEFDCRKELGCKESDNADNSLDAFMCQIVCKHKVNTGR